MNRIKNLLENPRVAGAIFGGMYVVSLFIIWIGPDVA